MASTPKIAELSPFQHSTALAQLPQDQIISILQLLPPDSILSFATTCRRFRFIAAADPLWESVCRRDFGGCSVDALLTSFSSRERAELSWKRLYRTISRIDAVSCVQITNGGGDDDGDGVQWPQPRASHSLNFVSDRLVLFGGGYQGGRHLDETWVAYVGNGSNRVLSWQKVNSGTPSGRFGLSCTVIHDALVLFGGINQNGSRLNDTWIGQVICEGPLKTKISWRLLDVGNISPSPRGAHAACHAGDGRIVIHGGVGLSGRRLSDTWLLDLSNGLKSARWYQMSNSKPAPLARSGHSLTWIGENRMVLFGGRCSRYEALNDVWLLDTGGGFPYWEELKYASSSVPGEMPLPRVGHSATLILGGKVLIYGGEDSHWSRKDDFWVLDVGAILRLQTTSLMGTHRKIWKKLKVEGEYWPEGRSFHRICRDRSGRYIFVFGGMVDGVVHEPDEVTSMRFDEQLLLVDTVLQL